MPDTCPAPIDDAALAATRGSAWPSLGRPAPAVLRAELMAARSEPHRHPHDQRQQRECLASWMRWRVPSRQPGGAAMAPWFHDAICDPQVGSNELNSAAWATRSLVRAGADSDSAQRVHDLAMSTRQATQHDAPAAPASSPDAQPPVDIDLSILGTPAGRLERYDRDLRKEYAQVPGLRYQGARAQVAVALLEAQARINLAAAPAFKSRRLAR